MKKNIAVKTLEKIQSAIDSLVEEKRLEVEQLTKEKVEPLLAQVEQIKISIDNLTHNKYKDRLSELNQEKVKVKKVVDEFKIKDANSLWYPKGTIVYLWEYTRTYPKHTWVKTQLKGIVDVYDGTQDLGSIPSWKFPKKGDLIVRHIKKDGSVGLKFDQISEYGALKGYFPTWCAEEDSAFDNPVTRKEKQDEN